MDDLLGTGCPDSVTYQKLETRLKEAFNFREWHDKEAMEFFFFFWLVAAWVKSRAERPSVSVVNRQLHVQIGCKLGIRNRKDELEASKAKQITN